jgi:uncharacterized protein (TIGR02996 family)
MEETFTRAILADPCDATAWLALADWLEENDNPRRAELLRLREALRAGADPDDRPVLEARLQRLIADGVSPPAALWDVPLSREATLELSLIPAGTFLMGSPEEENYRHDNEGPRHRVTISQPFLLGVFPVTQGQWQALLRTNPSAHTGLDHPVVNVNWHECQLFCAVLGRLLGRRCRLPYEAEWEYACRAGTTTTYHTGNDDGAIQRAGWCSYNGQPGIAGKSCSVGTFLPNAFGLYDMHGNVREWCQDDLRLYSRLPRTDPRGEESGSHRVLRGGSWWYAPSDSRAASRYSRPPSFATEYYGLRVVVPCEG